MLIVFYRVLTELLEYNLSVVKLEFCLEKQWPQHTQQSYFRHHVFSCLGSWPFWQGLVEGGLPRPEQVWVTLAGDADEIFKAQRDEPSGCLCAQSKTLRRSSMSWPQAPLM